MCHWRSFKYLADSPPARYSSTERKINGYFLQLLLTKLLGEVNHLNGIDPLSGMSSTVKNHLSASVSDDHGIQGTALKTRSVVDDIDDITVLSGKVRLPSLVLIEGMVVVVIKVGVASVFGVLGGSLIDKSLDIVDHDVKCDIAGTEGVASSGEILLRDEDVHNIALDVSVLPDVEVSAYSLDELEHGFIFNCYSRIKI